MCTNPHTPQHDHNRPLPSSTQKKHESQKIAPFEKHAILLLFKPNPGLTSYKIKLKSGELTAFPHVSAHQTLTVCWIKVQRRPAAIKVQTYRLDGANHEVLAQTSWRWNSVKCLVWGEDAKCDK